MQTIQLSDFQGNLDSLLGQERCEKRGTGYPFELLPPVEQGNWFPF